MYICVMEKTWKPIAGYENLYAVSDFGDVVKVKSSNNQHKKGKQLKFNMIKGYCHVQLHLNGNGKMVRVHRLVAQSFIPNPMNKPHVNHLNGVKNDNRVCNLEWCTPSENEKHSYDVLGKRPPNTVISKNDAIAIIERYSNGEKLAKISLDYGVSVSCLHGLVNGRTHKGLGLTPVLKKYRGSGNGSTHLTEADVLKMREMFLNDKSLTYKSVAHIFNVSYQTVSRIVNRKNWTHI